MAVGMRVLGKGDRHVLVLHGWFGDHGVWAPTFPFLDLESHTYAFPDYPGYGQSRDLPEAQSITELARLMLAVVDTLGWGAFSVVGHSMGGSVAQKLAATAPERILKIVGVTPVPATGVPLPPEVDELFDRVPDSDAAAEAVLNVSLGDRPTPAITRHILTHTRATALAAAMRSYGRAFRQEDFGTEASEKIRMPMLILYGERDGGVPEDFVKAKFGALYPHATITALPNVGHYPMIESPPFLIEQIEAFLST